MRGSLTRQGSLFDKLLAVRGQVGQLLGKKLVFGLRVYTTYIGTHTQTNRQDRDSLERPTTFESCARV